MTESLLNLVHEVMSSPWIYLALFTLSWLDGFLPAFPSESAVITAGVFAASGEPHWLAVMVVAALGAFAGDHTSYAIGHRFRDGVRRRAVAGSRRGAALAGARRALHSRGGVMIVVARYVPGGRTAVTVTAGTVGYPRRRFTAFTAIAAASWGVYCTSVGYLGGIAFEREPLKGVVLGIGLALGVTAIVEVLRLLVRRRRPSASSTLVSPAATTTTPRTVPVPGRTR